MLSAVPERRNEIQTARSRLPVLEHWLASTPIDAFTREYLGRQPYASPSTAAGAVSIFDWATLDSVLCRASAGDILVVTRGKLVNAPTPRTLADTRALLKQGIGLVIRHAESYDTALAALGHDLARAIPGEAHIQLFVTPGGTHGFGWHYDTEEVFIVQTDGAKDYFFRSNTIEPNLAESRSDFSRFSEETSAIGTARLIRGDWLYIPARWWHVAKCLEDSLSISIGIARGGDDRTTATVEQAQAARCAKGDSS
jgi:50S ribosomal protein L16 3-hydroxylase